MILRDKFANLRKEHGLTQIELAEQMGVGRHIVAKWENGIAAPNEEQLSRLAALYGISVEEMLGGGESTPTAEEESANAPTTASFLDAPVADPTPDSLDRVAYGTHILLQRDVMFYLEICRRSALWIALGIMLLMLLPAAFFFPYALYDLGLPMTPDIAVAIGFVLVLLHIIFAIILFYEAARKKRAFRHWWQMSYALKDRDEVYRSFASVVDQKRSFTIVGILFCIGCPAPLFMAGMLSALLQSEALIDNIALLVFCGIILLFAFGIFCLLFGGLWKRGCRMLIQRAANGSKI